ncbi:glycosyltransferase [Vibrio vulnificus]|nr:glycosyltransferase [Vibrio vulnificus]
MNKASIAIVTYNREDKLERAIRSCFTHLDYIDEIVIVDNASSDNTAKLVDSISIDSPIPISLIRTHKNIGCPRARNLSIANCKNKYVYCLDDDGWLDKETLRSSLNVVEEDVAVVVSRIVEPKSELDMGLVGKKRDVGKFSGGASLIDKDMFLKLGGFPDFFRQMEESHVSLMLLSNNKRIVFNPESKMFHEKIKSTRQNQEEARYNYLNEMRVIQKLFSLWMFIPLLMLKSISHARIYWKCKSIGIFLGDFLSSLILPLTKPLELVKKNDKLPLRVLLKQRRLK